MRDEITLPALRECASSAGFDLPDTVLSPLASYLTLLMQWNRVMNLVGTRTWRDTFNTLLIDSIHLAGFLSQPWAEQTALASATPQCWDLGSGAGLPGIPLRMLWTRGEYHMVEAREKRALFISTVLARTPLPQTSIFWGRVENFMAGPPPRTADLIVSRAFMPWPDLLSLVDNNLNPSGIVVLLLRAPLETQELSGWKPLASLVYPAKTTQRYLIALVKA